MIEPSSVESWAFLEVPCLKIKMQQHRYWERWLPKSSMLHFTEGAMKLEKYTQKSHDAI